jgi:GrpB-like predicted nucleotidyltransferase (UPF0157 family)
MESREDGASMNREDDRIVIADYDVRWPDRFAELASRVQAALGMLVLRVEHVGSTAVPGLAAKPIIDLDVVLASHSDLREVIRRLETLGYVHEGDLGVPGREAFRWPPGEARHHLYVLAADAAELRRHLAFRDALRADRTLRDMYAGLKRALALQYSHDRTTYTEMKSAFLTNILGS